jgi:hypothetical protein
MKPYLLITAGALLLCGTAAGAGIFRCASTDGGVQYRDTPCDSEASSLRRLDPPASGAVTPDARMDRTRRLLDAMREERRQKQQQAEEEKAAQAQRRQRCNQARDFLRSLERAGRVYRLDDAGNRVYLPEDSREEALDRARAGVGKWCG